MALSALLEQYTAYSVSVSVIEILFSSGNPTKLNGWTLVHIVNNLLLTLHLSMVQSRDAAGEISSRKLEKYLEIFDREVNF